MSFLNRENDPRGALGRFSRSEAKQEELLLCTHTSTMYTQAQTYISSNSFTYLLTVIGHTCISASSALFYVSVWVTIIFWACVEISVISSTCV